MVVVASANLDHSTLQRTVPIGMLWNLFLTVRTRSSLLWLAARRLALLLLLRLIYDTTVATVSWER